MSERPTLRNVAVKLGERSCDILIEGMSSSPPGPMPIGAPRPPRAIRRSKPPSCASAGGKAGINHATGKSLIGAFDRPIGNDETAAPG